MRKMVTLTLAFLIFSGSVGFAARYCECESGLCNPDGFCTQKTRSFTIPLGAITKIVAALIKKSIPVGIALLIPDIEIELSRAITGEGWVRCPSLCCEGEQKLQMFMDVELRGTGESSKYLCSSFSFTQPVRVKTVTDDGPDDDLATIPCEISTEFELTTAGLSLNFIFWGNVGVTVENLTESELEEIAKNVTGKVTGCSAEVDCACSSRGESNQRPGLDTPEEVVVPIGGTATFGVAGNDADGDTLWYSASPSAGGGVTVSIDQEEGRVTVDATEVTVKHEDTGIILVCVYDLKGDEVSDPLQREEYYHEKCERVHLKFIANRPPNAPDIERTVHAGKRTDVDFRVSDPDGDMLDTTLCGSEFWKFAQVVCGLLTPEGLEVLMKLRPTKENIGETYKAEYAVVDENWLVSRGTLIVHVVNEPPIAVGDYTETWQATKTDIDVLANDSDPDEDPLTIDEVSSPLHGTAEISDRGKRIQYTPPSSFVGTDSFSYWVTDGFERRMATVTVEVKDATPYPYREWVSVEAGESEYVTLQGYVPDGREGSAFDYTFTVEPPQASSSKWLISAFHSGPLQLNSTVFPVVRQEFLVKVDEDTPPDLYDLRIFLDNKRLGLSGENVLTVNVLPPLNEPPDIVPDSQSVEKEAHPGGGGGELFLLDPSWEHEGCFTVTDPDGDPLMIDLISAPMHGQADLVVSGGAGQYAASVLYRVSQEELLAVHRDEGGVYTETLELRARDPHGEEDTATLELTVEVLNRDPEAVADAITIEGADPVFIDVLDNDSDPDGDPLSIVSLGSSSHGTVVVVGDRIRYTPFSSGVDTFTYTISDGYGGEATATVTATIFLDTLPPNAVCRNITVELDAVGQATIVPTDVDGGSTDNYGIADYRIDRDTFTCADLGANPVVLTVEDYGGNTDSCTATVTVVDLIPPTAVGQSITVYLDANGEVSITSADINAGSTDNCGIASLQADPNTFTCADVGANPVTLTATDASGNTGSCQVTVTVLDDIAPTITAPVELTVSTDPGACHATNVDLGTPTVSDNCGIQSVTNNAPDPFNVGTRLVFWTVTDSHGNQATDWQRVVVVDNEDPTIVPPLDIATSTDPGLCYATNVDLGMPTTSDNCGIESVTNDAPMQFPVGLTVITWTARDIHGNTSSCIQHVTVQDNIDPAIIAPPDVTVNTDPDACYATDVELGTPSASDNCGIESITNDAPVQFPVGLTVITWMARDIHGNTSSCAQHVMVEDNILPTISAPADITVSTDPGACHATNVDLGAPTVSDNCGIQEVTNNAPDQFSVGLRLVLWTVEDLYGNSAVDWQWVTVVDDVSPVAVCRDITISLDVSGQATITTSDIDAGSTDNCGITSRQISKDSFACSDLGSNAVVLTVEDAGGNTDTCTTMVTLVDGLAPTALCRDITVSLDASGRATITASDIDGGSTDNCGIASRRVSQDSFTCSDLGPNLVSLTVEDASGNTDACTATVTVVDDLPPQAVCRNQTVYLDASGQAAITAADIDGGSTDNCGIVSRQLNQSTFTCADVGGNPVVLTVEDASGNTSQCTALVTVVDDIAPTITAPSDITVSTDGGSCFATNVDLGTPTVSDNCGIQEVTNNAPDQFTVGTRLILWTASDSHGNQAVDWQRVTVVDDVSPTALCRDITVSLDASGQASITPADADGGSTDNCGIASRRVSQDVFTCSDLGPNLVSLTVEDASGNTDACTATVTVVDDLPPQAVCRNQTVYLDASGQAAITAADIDGGSTDNCGIASLSLSQDTFTCSDLGPNPVVLTVEDASGNTSTCTAMVTVVDDRSPTITCPSNVTVNVDAGSCVATSVDLGAPVVSDNCGIQSLVDDATAEFPIGTTVVTWTATDTSGNASTCQQSVTVIDTTPPEARCQDITVYLNASGQASITPADVDAGSSDNCGISSRQVSKGGFTCSDLGPNLVSLTVEDASGNTDACTATVTVVDDLPPQAVCRNQTVYLDASGQAAITAADIDAGSADNCGIASRWLNKTTFMCADLGINTVTLTVEDTSGNTDTCAATVTVVDSRRPTMTCPANVTTEVDPGRCTATNVNLGTPIVNDNCGIASVTNDEPAQFPLGATWVTWTATDTSGNTETCTQRVTVEEHVPPTVNCPGNITTETTSSLGKVVTFSASATDNCDPSPNVSCSPPSGTRFPIGTTWITCTATDASGNQNTCQFTVTVNLSNQPPIARNDSETTQEDTTVWIPVLNNDSDPDGDPFSIDSIGWPWDGIAWESGGGINYRPDPGFFGTDSFTYTIRDSHGAVSNAATVTVTVEHVNHPPRAYDDLYIMSDGEGLVTIYVLNNDEDDDGDPLEVILVGSPSCGHTYLMGGGSAVQYATWDCTQEPGSAVYFSYTISDGQGGTSSAEVTVILPPNFYPTEVPPEEEVSAEGP